MKTILILGVALIAIGAAVLAFDQYSYTTKENVLQVGPLKATVDETHTVTLPPAVGWVLIGGGVCLLVLAAWSKKN